MRNMLNRSMGTIHVLICTPLQRTPCETFLSYSNYRPTFPPPPPTNPFLKPPFSHAHSLRYNMENDRLSVLRNGHNSQTLHPCTPALQAPKRHRRHNRAIPNEPIKPLLALRRCQITLEEGAVPSIRRYNRHYDRRRDV